jgi:hypothetical protein
MRVCQASAQSAAIVFLGRQMHGPDRHRTRQRQLSSAASSVLLRVDYCGSQRPNESGEVCLSFCETRKLKPRPGKGWGFCLCPPSPGTFTAGSSEPQYHHQLILGSAARRRPRSSPLPLQSCRGATVILVETRHEQTGRKQCSKQLLLLRSG